MEAAGEAPRTVEDVFREFIGRRSGILKALTTDAAEFYRKCDPEKENLCLYGFPNGQWEVNLPVEEVPPVIPEPTLGINFARDATEEKDWLLLIAMHCDAWLLSVAFFSGARLGFDKANRERLFNMINDLPPVFDVVNGNEKKQQKEKNVLSNHSSTKVKSNSKMQKEKSVLSNQSSTKVKSNSKMKGEFDPVGRNSKAQLQIDDEEDEHGENLCGACGENNASEEFWIWCDICEKWFHGKCVKVTPAMAEHIKQYKCPACSNKKARP